MAAALGSESKRKTSTFNTKQRVLRETGGNGEEEVIMTRLRIGHSNLNGTLHIITETRTDSS